MSEPYMTLGGNLEEILSGIFDGGDYETDTEENDSEIEGGFFMSDDDFDGGYSDIEGGFFESDADGGFSELEADFNVSNLSDGGDTSATDIINAITGGSEDNPLVLMIEAL